MAAMLLGGGAGLGIGVLIGLPALVGIAGLFAGLTAGFALVYSRFRDI